ncbi:WD40 repeat domain-containing protein, partial [bacterium]|nr:WD40 repeat domain-containing protein [bacterium]
YLRLFSFDGTALRLEQSVTVGVFTKIISQAWSPDGHYLAFGFNGRVVLMFFDGSQIEASIFSVYDTGLSGRDINAVSWSPDGRYIAVGDDTGVVTILTFDGRNIEKAQEINLSEKIYSLKWSPQGKVIAVGTGGATYTTLTGKLHMLSFNGRSVVSIDNENIGSQVKTISWAPNGKSLTIGGFLTGPKGYLKLFSFDGNGVTLVKQSLKFDYFDGTTTTENVDYNYITGSSWSPSGTFFAATQKDHHLIVMQLMRAPIHCLLEGNKVCDIFSYDKFVGTGFMGGGECYYFNNIGCNSEVDYAHGIPNVFYGSYSTIMPFDNIASRIPKFIYAASLPNISGTSSDYPQMAMA